MTQPPTPGWYAQPDGGQRYWDGQQWTTLPSPAAPPQFSPPPAPPQRPFWQKKRVIIPAAAVVALIAIGSLTGGGKGQGQSAAPAATPSAVQTTPTSSAATSPDQSPVADPSGDADVAESAEPTTFTMPNLVGKDLQDAQDELQALGSYVMDQQDASGKDRIQVIDSNWRVCSQDPAAGTAVAVDATVVLASVKDDERCPADGSDEPAQTMTASQEQAVKMAENYLDYTAFSRSGLIKQLKFEGFSTKDATFAVDYLDVDWNEQAAKMAENYLDYTTFSRKGLIKQLEFEGFSNKQATYGVKAAGL